MQSRSLLILLSALAVTSASPLRRRLCADNGTATEPAAPSSTVSVAYTLPSTGGATTLPSPGDATLKHIAVGHGIQNYTCTAPGANATSLGALAVLWDVTSLYPGSGTAALSDADWTALPPKVLRTTDLPLNLADAASSDAADVANPFPAPASLTVDGLAAPLAFLGHHFFSDTNVPTFDLSGDTAQVQLFSGKKDLGITAPADSDRGLTDTGAVDWLALSDKGGSENLSLVYRVVTAGGQPSACTETGQTESVAYAAQYWFY
ncbi:Uu.00g095820.m01.CDS01 [Anthostomella pinea]|uniref:Uu.00g095820.m01.CDS01 n=1 Tax=Anthostomella pinea TaxID=933095 RepID=A0AAI8YF07_9PEZI|nr:Uu.00g095820.m01.CDS01 [Anthostomella pinea]